MKIIHRVSRRIRRWYNSDIYRTMYETHAALHPEPIGNGPYDVIGQIELDLLRAHGLKPEHTLFDLGCGTGRLAVHAIPYLSGGSYIGSDISQQLLQTAQDQLASKIQESRCHVTWKVQESHVFAAPNHSVDMICAFSVFTHIEHEDAYRYLVDGRRVVRPGGKFVFSCLPLELAAAQDVLKQQAALDFGGRWCHVRNIVTSRDLMEQIARLAGWHVVQWHAGDQPNIPDENGQLRALGQSSCVLSAPIDAVPTHP